MNAVGGSTRPYPVEWERHLVLDSDWRIFTRPITAADEPSVLTLLSRVNKGDLRLRFFGAIKEFSHPFLVSLTQIDYAKAMAFIAFDEASQEPLGVVRMHRKDDGVSGEYAILLQSDLKGRGLGWALMQLIIEYSRSEGLKQIVGQIMRENTIMLQMCRELGFEVMEDAEDHGIYDVTLDL
jgi:acetyltransferase